MTQLKNLSTSLFSVADRQVRSRGRGSRTGPGWVDFNDGWYSKAWCEKASGGWYREWSGTHGMFTGRGGWFRSRWVREDGNLIPDISRHAGDPSHWPKVSSLARNYSIDWTGSGEIESFGSCYTFGLKFELTALDQWKDYDWTTSYECYIVTHTSRTDWSGNRQYPFIHIGTVYPPGSPVGYDCYKAHYQPFWQLWAVRRGNTWDGPVNVQAIIRYWAEHSGTSLNYDSWHYNGNSICVETNESSGCFKVRNIDIPNISVPGRGGARVPG